MLGEMPSQEDFERLINAWKTYNGTWYESSVMDGWLARCQKTREQLNTYIESGGKDA